MLGFLRSLFLSFLGRLRPSALRQPEVELDRRGAERAALIEYQRAGHPLWRPDPAKLRRATERASDVVEPD